MGKTMQEVIKENHKKSYEEHMRKIKKQNKKDTILGYFVMLFVIVITCVCINLISKQEQDFVKTCTEKGYSQNYCIEHM